MNNINQLLMRNQALLVAQSPLLVNLPVDEFIDEYLALQPSAHITCFNTNFEFHQQVLAQKNHRVSALFTAHYQSKNLHDLAIIQFPKSKAELTFTLEMLAECVSPEASILIVGENKSGIKSLEKLTKEHLKHCNKIDAARHCLLFHGQLSTPKSSFKLDEWLKSYKFSINEIEIEVVALPGVFSQKGLDVGTNVLLHNLPDSISGKVLDFGCGAGVIACYLGKKQPEVELTLLDVNALALYSAEKTLELNQLNGDTIASNSLSELTGKYNSIISNPPFHQGIKTNYQATETFLTKIKNFMMPQANITVVANSFLQYMPIMERNIGKTIQTHKEKGFTLYHCNL